MINVKEIFRVGVILFAITAVSAALLAGANKVTAPVIAENNKIKTEKAMQTVFADADSFEQVQIEKDGIVEAYVAKSGNSVAGSCVVSEAYGYGGAVRVMTGVTSEGKVTGIDILSHAETPGLGANATKPEFKEQYKDKSAGIKIAKSGAGENEINAMSGATITSTAVTNAVNIALDAAGEIVKEAQ